MKRQGALAFLISIMTVCFTLAPFAHAALPAGMTQGEFALWIVKKAGAMRQLPAAASAEDAVKFLQKIGVVPEGGWNLDAEVTKEFLLSFLDEKDRNGEITEDQLLDTIEAQVASSFDSTDTGESTSQQSGSGS